jgi:hypothetical protein
MLAVLIGLAVAWLVLGVLGNVRRGHRAAGWAAEGLRPLGQRTDVRWVGTSAVELEVAEAAEPFRRASARLVLVPREAPWRWIASLLTGQGDLLVFRADLISPPVTEFRVDARGSWAARSASRDGARRRWTVEDTTRCVVSAPRAGWEAARDRAVTLMALAGETHSEVLRLTVRRGSPHFEAYLPLPSSPPQDPEQFFRPVSAWAKEAMRPSAAPV